MKIVLFPLLAAASGLLMMSCDGQPAALSQTGNIPPTPPAGPPAPVTPEADENALLEQQIAELKAQEAELRLQIEQDQLAQEKAELERQRDELAKEKAALEAAAANPPSATSSPAPPGAPVPSASRTEVATTTTSITAAPAAGSRDYQMFYESLAPYGQWMETSDYGYVWQPSERPAGWRPYTVGRWADSDQGWTWVSDEPFGWATYHYGRWALLERHGWIWVPGDTWAPAWVAWRNNADLVGWSPLPPETVYVDNSGYGPRVDDDYGISPDWYTFMPVRHFDAPVYDHFYPATENFSYFSLTIGVTRIAFRSGNVYCDGPDRGWINGRLSRPMTRYRLDRDFGYDHGDRHDYRPRFDNDRISYYSPRVRNSWNEGLRPSRLKGRLDDVRVVRRQDSFRGELGRRYQEEQRERRGRATDALQQEPVRRLAERQGALERVRSQRDQLSQRRENSGRGRTAVADATVRPARSDASDRTRGEGARQNALQNEKLDASRKELTARQEEVTRLRQQRETQANTRSDRGAPPNNRETESARGNNPAVAGNIGRPQGSEAEGPSRRGEAGAREAQQREELKQRQEEVARLRQQRDTAADNQSKNETPRGQRSAEAARNRSNTQQRDESARRGPTSNPATSPRTTQEPQRGQRNGEADQARAAAARRDQATQNAARQRAAEAQQRGQRESQAAQVRTEAARREQARQSASRPPAAEVQQRGQRESQASSVRAEAASRDQARQRSAEAQQRSQRESEVNKARAEAASRDQARQRSAEAQQRSQRESQANQARAEAARRDQARQNESRQRQAAQQQERSNRARAESARRPQAAPASAPAPAPPRQREAPPQSRKKEESKSEDDKKRRGR